MYFKYIYFYTKMFKKFIENYFFSLFAIKNSDTSDTLIFQTMNFVRSNNLGLKYSNFTPSSCIDIGV